jgi:hypothetical protein
MDKAFRRRARLYHDRLRRHRGLHWNLRGFKLTISAVHMDEGRKAKEETRQNSSPSSQSFTSFAIAPKRLRDKNTSTRPEG